MAIRNYSSVAAETTLQSGVNNVSTVILVQSTLGFPAAPFTLAVDYGAATEELMDVTAVAGLSLTVTRAVDGTAATTHGAGAKVRHVSSARDFRESNTHINTSAGVHGIVGSVVGTTDPQTLSSKTLTNPAINNMVFDGTITGGVSIESNATNETTLRIKEVASQSSPTFEILDQSAALIMEVGSQVGFNRTTLNSAIDINMDGAGGTVWKKAGSGVASINTDGDLDSHTVDLASGALLTAATGWSISALTVATLKGGVITLNGTVTRTGANITVDAAGALSTGIIAMATILPTYRPKSTLGVLYFHSGNSIATGTARINTSSTGVVELVRWQASQTITTGNAVSFTISYPIT